MRMRAMLSRGGPASSIGLTPASRTYRRHLKSPKLFSRMAGFGGCDVQPYVYFVQSEWRADSDEWRPAIRRELLLEKGSRGSDRSPPPPNNCTGYLTTHLGSDPAHQGSSRLRSDLPAD